MKRIEDITELVKPDLPASKIAQYIRKDILEQTHLTASAGVSYNKFLAKLASGMNKPDGMTVIDYQNVHDILMTLDIGDFPGVGKASKKKCMIMVFLTVEIYMRKRNLN